MYILRNLILTLLISLAATPVWAGDVPGPAVVVSIKPLHSLVAGVMQGVAEPGLLIKGGGSPHGYMLRPSEARSLAEADLVVWVGPGLENFLVKPLDTLGEHARRLTLAEALAPDLLPVRKGGSWEEHAEHPPDGADAPEHDHGEADQHLWLDPRLAKRVVAETVAVLVEVDPEHRQQYCDNADRLQERLDNLDLRLRAEIEPVRQIPYLVFHDAYQYFEKAYGLRAVGSITVDPERKPGARRIMEMRDKIKAAQAHCIFSEPQFEPRLVATVIEGSGVATGVLDPLGAELPAGTESYFLLLEGLAKSLVACLKN